MIVNIRSKQTPPKDHPLIDINNNLLKYDDYITVLEDDEDHHKFSLDVMQTDLITDFQSRKTYITYLRSDNTLSFQIFNRFRVEAYIQPENIALKITIKNEL